jgi:cyclopropane-fatty-acyl-phospholipid synthase
VSRSVVDELETRAGASAAAIEHHYDVGNAFYALWLDRSMTYSSALWRDEGDDLEAAQVAKHDWHIDRSGIMPGGRFLDVGCGWGALMKRVLARHPSSTCVGLTLAREQADYVRDLNDPRIEVRLESWEDHRPASPYRGIVSVGAFEHFARLDQSEADKVEAYRRFFRFCAEHLEPDGKLSLQTIVYENSSRAQFSQFFADEIFPESDLPHLSEIS